MKIFNVIGFCFALLPFCGCRPPGGTIPVYYEPSVNDVESRFFILQDTLTGLVVAFQPSYPCNNGSIIYNSTVVAVLDNKDTITAYSPCFYDKIKMGDSISMYPIHDLDEKLWATNRQILKKPTKKDSYYPYWKCISCKYKNTRAYISLNRKEN